MPFSKRWDRTLNVLSFIAFNHAVLRDCKQWRWENVMLHNRSSVLVLVFLFSYGFKHPTLFEYAEFVVVGTGEEALFTCVCVCVLWVNKMRICFYILCVVGASPPVKPSVARGRDFGCQRFVELSIIEHYSLLLIAKYKIISALRTEFTVMFKCDFIHCIPPVSIRTRI